MNELHVTVGSRERERKRERERERKEGIDIEKERERDNSQRERHEPLLIITSVFLVNANKIHYNKYIISIF